MISEGKVLCKLKSEYRLEDLSEQFYSLNVLHVYVSYVSSPAQSLEDVHQVEMFIKLRCTDLLSLFSLYFRSGHRNSRLIA